MVHMLTNLVVHNFKSLAKLDLPIYDLNILIGPNNSGKTSVFQTLAFLKQSINGLNFNGPLVNLGSFDELIFKHDEKRELFISFSIKPRRRNAEWSQLLCTLEIARDQEGVPILRTANVYDQHEQLIAAFDSRRQSTVEIRGFIPFLRPGVPSEHRVDINAAATLIQKELLEYLYYISSSRGSVQRGEPLDHRYSDRPSDVGVKGEKTMQVLAHIRDNEQYAEVLSKFNNWASHFGIENVIASLSRGPTYELKGRNRMIDVQSNVIDTGFGLNQLIPVILQCFYAKKGSLVLIEQPEAHLHPKAQADITDMLIDVVNYGNSVMVETHSEHILLRLQRRVAEKQISPERIGIHYFEQMPDGTQVRNISIDKSGNFSGNIPPGFFEEGFQEAYAHLKAMKTSRD